MATPAKSRRFRYIATASAGLALSCPLGTPPTIADIVVEFPGTTAANPPLLLYSGREGANCPEFEPHVANPTVTLDDVSFDITCPVEMDAFAPGLGAFARSLDPTVPGDVEWLETAIESGSLAISLPELTSVPLRLWIVASTATDIATAKGMRDRLLDKAYPILETMGTGLTLDTASSPLIPSVIDPNCDKAGIISTNPLIYDATRINVYFVRNYRNLPDLTPAQNCWLKTHPEIVFISWGNSNVVDPTLAHELGHALGLVHPNADGGHTYLVPGFDAFNLMATNTDVTNASIGQLYALNFSSGSWLNRTGSLFVKPVVRDCQDSWGTGVCPALTSFEPGWPP
ncbi:MAG TPA: hypothetical protein VIK50_13730 [Gemmatimonadaceae bacterium]